MTRDASETPLRFSMSSLFVSMLASALILAAAQRFLGMALRPKGVLAGGVFLLLGCAVGDVIGSQRVPRIVVIVVSLAFYIGIVNGMISNVGDELTLWGFLCMCTGLLIGAFFRTFQTTSPPSPGSKGPNKDV